MQILNAMQLKAGAKAEYNKMGTITQPIQFLPRSEKDEEWTAWNMDWLEWQGVRQLQRNARRLMKNYKLAKGIIDRTDYIIEDDNDYSDLVDILTKEDSGALELKFYPIVPNVINTLVEEFNKRNSTLTYRAVDEFSFNEQLEKKREMLEKNLLADAQQKMITKMIEMGLSPEDPEVQQAMAPENLKTLPEIEQFFRKGGFQSVVEQWASKQHKVDEERFYMQELEAMAFRDSLTTDREFWHFKMMEDDYQIELWNPVLTFYHKSPDVRYVSQGNWVGKVDMMSISDVIDKYGSIMNEEQLKSMENIYPIRAAGYPVTGYQNDGHYYDPTRSHAWNTDPPSLQYRQFVSMYDNFATTGGDIVNRILSESEDYMDMGMNYLLRVTTIYWKSQRRIGHLTKIDEVGEIHTSIVDETYKITDKPVYDTTLFKNKNKDNLLFGEHIDWIWINQTYGGVKIGPNHPSFWGMSNPSGVNPIYLGIDTNKIGPLKFQFKGDNTIYGCKLPVEGSIFSDRNTRSVSLVDLMKPFQIGYNIVNNQIADILVDELGTVILLDQNMLPKHSMGEDWGKHNFAKAYVAMKNFQMLPLDTSIANTENGLNFQHFQPLNLEQTNRLVSRVNLANYFKQQAMEIIGITPQRLGQAIGQQTATGVEQSVNASYAQTEVYFTQHCDHLMPRVHQMRTDLAQFYQSRKPSVQLQYTTTTDEKMLFEISGTDLLTRDLNVFCSTKANYKAVLERFKSMLEQNNTTGASIYDLGKIMYADTMGELTTILKGIETKQKAEVDAQRQHEAQLQEQALQAAQQEKALERDFQAMENEKDRRAKILEAEIRAAGYGAMQDLNDNQQSDYLDFLDREQKSEQYQETVNLQREKESNRMTQHADNVQLTREKIAAERDRAQKDLEVARENKDTGSSGGKKK